MAVAVYFTSESGLRYRVYDVTYLKRHVQRPIGDPKATSRLFVPAAGAKRSYKFRPGDSRVLNDELLEQQLRAADYLPTEKPGGFEGNPR